MDIASGSEANKYYCSCDKVVLDRENIISHLNLRSMHRISSSSDPNISFKDFNDSILNRIQEITKVQLQIQKSSNQLIQNIIQNTSNITAKLNQLIKVYRDLMLKPPKEVDEIKKFEIADIFEVNRLLYTALIEHFQQKLIVERITKENRRKNIKSQVLNLLEKKLKLIKCMAVFNDEINVVTGGDNGDIRIWNLESKSQTWFIIKHRLCINSLALGRKNELLLSGSTDNSVQLWNLKLRKHLHVFEGHTNTVYSVLISSDNKTGFSGSFDSTIRLWNLNTLSANRIIASNYSIKKICLINEDKVVVAAQLSGPVIFFNLKSNKLEKSLPWDNSNIWSLCFSQDEKQFIIGRCDGNIEVWQSGSFERIFHQKKHTGQINDIKISTFSDYFASGSNDATVIIWDLKNLCLVNIIKKYSSVIGIYFFKSASSIIILSENEIDTYNLCTFKNEIKIYKKPFKFIKLSEDLKYIAYVFNKIKLFDLQSNKKLSKSLSIKEEIKFCKFSPNSDYLAVGNCYKEILILKIPSLLIYKRFSHDLSDIFGISISKNNKFLGLCDFKTKVIVISIETGEIIYKKEGLFVKDLIFCYNNDKFIYIDYDSIFVLDNKFTKETVVKLSGMLSYIIASEDDSYVLVHYNTTRWNIIRLENLEKVYEDADIKNIKEWCVKRKDLKCRIYLSLIHSLY